MTTPDDVFRMIARAIASGPAGPVITGGVWQTQGASGRRPPYVVLRIEGDESEQISDKRLIMRGTAVLELWTDGSGQGAAVALRVMARSVARDRLVLDEGRILTWKPATWESAVSDTQASGGADVNQTGLAYRFAIETKGD